MPRFVLFTAMVATFAVTAPAGAQQVAGDPPVRLHAAAAGAPVRTPPPARVRRWYGWQIAAALAVPDALLLAGGALAWQGKSAAIPVLTLGGTAHAFAPGVVHWAHDHHGTALWSFGLETLGPVLGAAAGAGVARQMEAHCAAADVSCVQRTGYAFVTGAVAGGVLASVADIAFLARDEVSPRSPARVAPSVGLVPIPVSRGFGLGVGGAF